MSDASLEATSIPTTTQRGRLPRFVPITAAVFVAAGLVAVGGWWWNPFAPSAASIGPTAAAARGPLSISVSASGTIRARDQVVIKNEVRARNTTITFLVPEGTQVEPGELIIKLDSTVLEDELYDEEIDVARTEAAFLQAQENLEVVKSQAESDVAQAELDYRFAKEDVRKYKDGEYPKQLKEARNRIVLAEQELQQAKNWMDASTQLNTEKYLSDSELEKDVLAFRRAELDLELAEADLELLREFTHKRQLAQLESDVEQARMALERIKRRARADVVQAEASLIAEEKQLTRQRAQLADIKQQIENCTIESPVRGMIVYATTGRGGWRGNDEPLAVGREVREQEELVYIPTADAKNATVKVHESALEKIEVGQFVRVSVDALPDRVITGEVSRIAPLPDAQSFWMNPDLKVYETDIVLTGDLGGVRTGMTCEADIVVAEYEDALHVPVHAVVRVAGQPLVYVDNGGALAPQPVEIGLDNNSMVHILAGLEVGQQVALAPPLSPTAGAAAVSRGEQDRDRDADSGGGERQRAAATPNASKNQSQATGKTAESDNAGRGTLTAADQRPTPPTP